MIQISIAQIKWLSNEDDGASSFMARNDLSRCGYMPLFPASCPYVTAVGGTQVIIERE